MKVKKLTFLLAVLSVFCVASVLATVGVAKASADGTKIAVTIESYSGEWKAAPSNPSLTVPQNALDGDMNTAWYCQWGKADNKYGDAPSMTLDFGGEKTVSRIEIGMASDYVPQDILAELGDGNGAWAEAGRFSGMTAGETIVCHVPAQRAKKLRVTVMEKSVPDNNGYTLAKIAEIAAYSTAAGAVDGLGYYKDVTAGTVLCSDAAQRAGALGDGVYTVNGKDNGEVISLLYTDYVSDEAACDATVAYRFSDVREIGKLTLWGASDAGEIYGFPRDFVVVYSPDGSDWYIVPNQVYYDFLPTGGENAFVFDDKISAAAVGIRVLEKSLLKNGSYAVSLNEMRVFSSPFAGEAIQPLPEDSADSSVISSTEIPGGIYAQDDVVEIDLSAYFRCDAGALAYSAEGLGGVEGHIYRAELSGASAGRYTVTVTAALNDFCKKRSVFVIAVQSDGQTFVVPVAATVERKARAGETLEIELAELFRYTGGERLTFECSEGTIVGGTLTLVYETSGSYLSEIFCYPENDKNLGATVALTVAVTKGGVETNTLTLAGSQYRSPAAQFALAGGIGGAAVLAGLAVLTVLTRRKKK